jgi:hypothetical protein
VNQGNEAPDFSPVEYAGSVIRFSLNDCWYRGNKQNAVLCLKVLCNGI